MTGKCKHAVVFTTIAIVQDRDFRQAMERAKSEEFLESMAFLLGTTVAVEPAISEEDLNGVGS